MSFVTTNLPLGKLVWLNTLKSKQARKKEQVWTAEEVFISASSRQHQCCTRWDCAFVKRPEWACLLPFLLFEERHHFIRKCITIYPSVCRQQVCRELVLQTFPVYIFVLQRELIELLPPGAPSKLGTIRQFYQRTIGQLTEPIVNLSRQQYQLKVLVFNTDPGTRNIPSCPQDKSSPGWSSWCPCEAAARLSSGSALRT